MSLLDVEQLYVQFASSDAPTVRDVSFSVKRGQITAIIGESGSGKSVTALSLLGINPATHCPHGRILFEGEDLLRADESYRRSLRGSAMSIIFQEPMTSLNPLHTIGKQLTEIIALHQPDKTAYSEDIIRTLLEEVELPHLISRLHHYPHQLSGGERQRVMIAMAIANRPALLIADEPTTALDVTTQAHIIALLQRLKTDHAMGILLITHDLHLVRNIADSLVIMQEGVVIEQGNASEIFANPEHSYTKTLLSAMHSEQPISLIEDNHEPLITTKDLSVTYASHQGFSFKKPAPVVALHPASISVDKGTTLGIVGESGSGKTTLGLAIARLISSNGTIIYQGTFIDALSGSSLKSIRKQLQFVFQDPFSSLNPRMTIATIIGEGLKVHYPHYSEHEHLTRVERILEDVGLDANMANRYPHEFSGGQRQRINIARAMILEPDCVIFDEPTSALDMALQIQIIALLKKFQKNKSLSYIFISHDMASIRSISHKIVVMKEGHIVEYDNAYNILHKPKNTYTQQLIDASSLDI